MYLIWEGHTCEKKERKTKSLRFKPAWSLYKGVCIREDIICDHVYRTLEVKCVLFYEHLIKYIISGGFVINFKATDMLWDDNS